MALSGRVAVVTGASGGIGRAIAHKLAAAGATVVVVGRRQDALAKVCEEHSAAMAAGGLKPMLPVSCDVTDELAVVALFEQVRLKCGPCNLLVNCAGITGPKVSTVDLSAADFKTVLDVNIVGPMLCAREAFKQMINAADRPGRIINVGSISAVAPRPDSCAYTTSKFALQGLTRSLALDGRAHNIAVGAIHPGNVLTDLLSPEEIARRTQAEGFISTDDVASCVLQMASLPPEANVLEMTVMPTTQPLVGRG